MRGLPTVRTAHALSKRACRGATSSLFHGPVPSTAHGRHVRVFLCGAPRTFLNLNGILGGGSAPEGDRYNDTVVLPYSTEELYNVVSDVDSYSQFVPFCVASRVLGPTQHPDPQTKQERATRVVDAELAIGFSAVRESYVSEVSMRPSEFVTVRHVLTQARAKPSTLFHELSTTWQFDALPAVGSTPQTRVKFSLQYAFTSQIYAALARQMFEKLSGNMIAAFTQRAQVLYGHRGSR